MKFKDESDRTSGEILSCLFTLPVSAVLLLGLVNVYQSMYKTVLLKILFVTYKNVQVEKHIYW